MSKEHLELLAKNTWNCEQRTLGIMSKEHLETGLKGHLQKWLIGSSKHEPKTIIKNKIGSNKGREIRKHKGQNRVK